MDEHIHRVEELFSAAKTEFKHLEFYYFHNCVYDFMWKNNRRRYSEKFSTWDLIRKYNKDYKLIFVGDATMSPYEILQPGGSVEYNNEEAGRGMAAAPHQRVPEVRLDQPRAAGRLGLPAEHLGDPAAHEPAHVPAHPARARRSHATAGEMRRGAAAAPGAVGAAAGRRCSAGCASLPFFGKDADADERRPRAEPAGRALRARGARAGPLRTLLLDYLDLARFQNAPASEAITPAELERLAAAAPAQARALLETEGYFDADVKVTQKRRRRRPAAHRDRRRARAARRRPQRRDRLDRAARAAHADARRALARPPRQAARDLVAARGRAVPPAGLEQRQERGARRAARRRLSARRMRSRRRHARIDAVEHGAGSALVSALTCRAAGRCSTSAPIRIEGTHRYDEAAIRRVAAFSPGTRVQREAAARLPGADPEARPVRRRVGRARRDRAAGGRAGRSSR